MEHSQGDNGTLEAPNYYPKGKDTIDTVVTLNYLFCVVERHLVGEEVFVLQKYTDHLTGHCNHQNTLTIR